MLSGGRSPPAATAACRQLLGSTSLLSQCLPCVLCFSISAAACFCRRAACSACARRAAPAQLPCAASLQRPAPGPGPALLASASSRLPAPPRAAGTALLASGPLSCLLRLPQLRVGSFGLACGASPARSAPAGGSAAAPAPSAAPQACALLRLQPLLAAPPALAPQLPHRLVFARHKRRRASPPPWPWPPPPPPAAFRCRAASSSAARLFCTRLASLRRRSLLCSQLPLPRCLLLCLLLLRSVPLRLPRMRPLSSNSSSHCRAAAFLEARFRPGSSSTCRARRRVSSTSPLLRPPARSPRTRRRSCASRFLDVGLVRAASFLQPPPLEGLISPAAAGARSASFSLSAISASVLSRVASLMAANFSDSTRSASAMPRRILLCQAAAPLGLLCQRAGGQPSASARGSAAALQPLLGLLHCWSGPSLGSAPPCWLAAPPSQPSPWPARPPAPDVSLRAVCRRSAAALSPSLQQLPLLLTLLCPGAQLTSSCSAARRCCAVALCQRLCLSSSCSASPPAAQPAPPPFAAPPCLPLAAPSCFSASALRQALLLCHPPSASATAAAAPSLPSAASAPTHGLFAGHAVSACCSRRVASSRNCTTVTCSSPGCAPAALSFSK